MKTRCLSKATLLLLLTILLITLLGVTASAANARSVFYRNWRVSGETLVTQPTPGKISYAYGPESQRTDSPGYFGTTYGLDVNDGCSVWPGEDGEPYTADDDLEAGFKTPRDFSLALTYVLTAEESAAADLSRNPVFGLRAGSSNTSNLTLANTKYKVILYTSTENDEKIERIFSYPTTSNATPTLFVAPAVADLTADIAGLTDKTVEKIVIIPFYDVFDRPITGPTGSVYQTKFLLQGFGTFQSTAEAELVLYGDTKITYSKDLSLDSTTPDSTIAVVTSLDRLVNKPARLSAMTSWIVANKDALNIKLVPIVGPATMSAQTYTYATANTNRPSEYSSTSVYLNALIADPTLVIPNALKSTEPLHTAYKNIADAFRQVSEAGIHLSVAYYHLDAFLTQTRNHVLWNAYFRFSASDVEDYMGSSGSGFSNVSYNRVNINPTGMAGVDFGQYNSQIGFDYYTSISGGVKNTWYTFSAGGQDYLAISLEMHPTKAVRAWFKNLVESNPHKKVIVFLTGYMDPTGKLYTIWDDEVKFTAPEDIYNSVNYPTDPQFVYAEGTLLFPVQCYSIWKPSKGLTINGFAATGTVTAMYYYTTGMQTALWTDATDGDMFWNNYLSRYKNIYMIIDGGETNNGNAASSITSDGTTLTRTTTSLKFAMDLVTRQDTGIHGNTVYTIQANPHEYVKEFPVLLLLKLKGNKTEISYYIPELDAYINPSNNVFEIDNPPILTPFDLTVGTGKISGLDPSKRYQYKALGAENYIDVPAGSSEISGLAQGKYEVSLTNSMTYIAGEPVVYFVPGSSHQPTPMDWNMSLPSRMTQAQLTALGYTNADLQINRNNYFQDSHNTVAKSGTSNTTPGEWVWVQNSTATLARVAHDSGFYAARSPYMANNLQHWSYIFRESEIFNVKDRSHFVLSLSAHESISQWSDYRRVLLEADVKPTSRVLIYLYGKKQPYEIIQTRNVTSTVFDTYIIFNVDLPSDLDGYIERIEIYPMYQYWPEPDSTSSTYSDGTSNPNDPTTTTKWRCHLYVNGIAYEYYLWNGSSGTSSTNFYAAYALHLRQIGFYSSKADATSVATSPLSTVPSFTRARFDSSLNPAWALKEGDFTIAILPNLSTIASDSGKVDTLVQWIINNKSLWNIQMVSSAGLHTTAESRYQYFWKTGADYATLFGYSPEKQAAEATKLSNYSTSILYLGAMGGIQLADKSYSTLLRDQAENISASLLRLSAANIPLSITSAAYDNLGALANRVKLMGYYIEPEDLIQTGRLDTGITLTFTSLNSDGNLNKLEADGNVLKKEYYKDIRNFENTYHTFTVQGTDYLVLTLEAWPRQAVRTWANDLLAMNSDKNAIIIVPEFYNSTGTALINCWNSSASPVDYVSTLNTAAKTSVIRNFNMANNGNPLDGSEIWRLVLQKHSNIKLIYDAGMHLQAFSSNVVTDVMHHELLGVNGNTVHVLQGSIAASFGQEAGHILLLKFTDGGNTVDAITYIPEYNSYSVAPLTKEIVFDTYDVTVDSSVAGIEGITGVAPGQTVTLSVTPPEGKKVKVGSLKISYETSGDFFTDVAGATTYRKNYVNTVEKILLADKSGNFSFTMPHSDVVVTSVEYIDTAEHNIALSASGIRLDGPQGMRFLATFYLDGVDATYRDLWSYGVLIVPTQLLTEGSIDLRFDSDGSLHPMILDIPMINYYYYAVSKSTGTGYFHYTGVLNNIPADANDMDLSAVAYVKYTTDGVNFTYAYSDVYHRTYLDVVESAFLSGKESTANEAILNTLLKTFSAS